jgi:HK97 family phage portal protein
MPGPIDALTRLVARAVVTTRMSKSVSFTSRGVSEVRLGVDERRWTASAVAYRSILAISSNASALRLTVRDAENVAVEHELTQLWQTPNPLLSGVVFAQYIWQRLETRGETFVYVDRGDSGVGPIQSMWPIFGKTTVIVDKTVAGEIVGYVVDVGGKKVGLLPSEVLWLRYPDGENEWGALSPLAAAAHAIGLDAYARAWQEGELRNGARPSAVVYLGDLEQEQHEATVDAYRSRIEGPHNSGRTLFVSSANAAKVERMSLTPAELGWLDTRRSAWEEVLLAFGVPKDYLVGGATYENRDAARSTLWSDTIVPKLAIVASELTRQVLADDPRQLHSEFDTSDVDALQESADARATRTNAATAIDVFTLDEARAQYGLDDLPNGLGKLTLSAYRTLLTFEAQQALAGGQPAQLDRLAIGALEQSAPKLALPQRVKRAGLTFDEAQNEYDVHERAGKRVVKRLAGKQERIVLNNLHKLFGRSSTWKTQRDALLAACVAYRDTASDENETAVRAHIDALLDEELAKQQTREELHDFLATVWTRGSSTTATSLGLSFDKFELDVLVAMDARLDALAGQVTETTRRVLEDRVLLQGVANGETVEELAARVRATFTDLSSWRATMIARTETVGGFNHASMLTAQQSNVVKRRVWEATGDKRTRESHMAISGETVEGFKTPYSNGCRFPGDPMGPADETILCRCVEQYETE